MFYNNIFRYRESLNGLDIHTPIQKARDFSAEALDTFGWDKIISVGTRHHVTFQM